MTLVHEKPFEIALSPRIGLSPHAKGEEARQRGGFLEEAAAAVPSSWYFRRRKRETGPCHRSAEFRQERQRAKPAGVSLGAPRPRPLPGGVSSGWRRAGAGAGRSPGFSPGPFP